MCDDDIRNGLSGIKRRKSGGEYTLHKPLLLMLILGHYWNNGDRLVSYRKVYMPLLTLLSKFSGWTKFRRDRTLPPFVRLASLKGIWETTIPQLKDYHYKEAIELNLKGGFCEPLYRRIINDKPFLLELVFQIHKEYMGHVSLELLLESVNIPKRTIGSEGHILSQFESESVIADDSKCAVCSYQGKLAKKPVALWHTHVKWPIAGGPRNDSDNILQMCSLHKELFDCGTFTFNSESKLLKKSPEFKDSLLVDILENSIVRADGIRPEYLRWHNQEVFIK